MAKAKRRTSTPLRQWMEARGIGYRDLAELLRKHGKDISDGHARNIAGGNVTPSFALFCALRDVTGLTERDFAPRSRAA